MSNFYEMPPNARVWIYQSNRQFNAVEIQQIETDASKFIAGWNSHQVPMRAAAKVIYNTFLVIVLDESAVGASGCGIDKSVHFVKQLEQQYNLNFFNRLNICYTHNLPIGNHFQKENLSVLFTHISQINSIAINNTTHIFNNSISTFEQLTTQWIQPIQESWVANKLLISDNK